MMCILDHHVQITATDMGRASKEDVSVTRTQKVLKKSEKFRHPKSVVIIVNFDHCDFTTEPCVQ